MNESYFSMITAVPETINALQNGMIIWSTKTAGELNNEYKGQKFKNDATVFFSIGKNKWCGEYTVGLFGEVVYKRYDLEPNSIAYAALKRYCIISAGILSHVDGISIRHKDAEKEDDDIGVVVIKPSPDIIIAYIESLL